MEVLGFIRSLEVFFIIVTESVLKLSFFLPFHYNISSSIQRAESLILYRGCVDNQKTRQLQFLKKKKKSSLLQVLVLLDRKGGRLICNCNCTTCLLES
jgi:hypothetical protein